MKGDVYSCGVMSMETYTRRKPTDETFAGEMNLKHWVTDLMQSVCVHTPILI